MKIKPLSAHCAALTLFIPFLTVPAAAQVRTLESSHPTNIGSVKDADPFDVSTGIYSRTYSDLFVKDSIPIDFVRTQRNMDSRSRSFGLGGMTSYDMFIIGDVNEFSWVALVLADGAQIRYARISPGKGLADGVFEEQSTPGIFFKSRIAWDQHHAWTVTLADGTEYLVRGCNATSKPGQCAVSRIKNQKGEILTVDRDPDGDITRIASPHGHSIQVTNDTGGRITRAQSDDGHWVTYKYDDGGRLVEAHSWRGDHQNFAYDKQSNMTFIHERGPSDKPGRPYNFSITNHYGAENRFSSQKISSGERYSATYYGVVDGHAQRTEVRGPLGLSKYFFNADGYEIRREFHPVTGFSWSLNHLHDATSNATTGLVLTCASGKVHIPLSLKIPLNGPGDTDIPFLSKVCQLADQKKLGKIEDVTNSADSEQ
jgi:YD repeat-containing protein